MGSRFLLLYLLNLIEQMKQAIKKDVKKYSKTNQKFCASGSDILSDDIFGDVNFKSHFTRVKRLLPTHL